MQNAAQRHESEQVMQSSSCGQSVDRRMEDNLFKKANRDDQGREVNKNLQKIRKVGQGLTMLRTADSGST